jgi:ferritin-like protein
MSSENLHAPRDRLQQRTILMHQAIVSLMEELDAIDWYQQRADDCDDPALKEILLHNMREEVEHASMALEWLRRNSEDFDRHLRTYLFSEGPITEIEKEAEAGETPEPAKVTHRHGADGAQGGGDGGRGSFTIGPMKSKA